MPISVSTSTIPAVLPEILPVYISNSAWYITEFRMAVEYLPKILRKTKTNSKIALYATRTFEIDCQIDKKLEPPELSINLILNKLHIIKVNGLVKDFRWPKLDPMPSGASIDPTKNISNSNYDWRISQWAWFYDMDKQKYITLATVIGSWKEWAYLGTQWITTYEEE